MSDFFPKQTIKPNPECKHATCIELQKQHRCVDLLTTAVDFLQAVLAKSLKRGSGTAYFRSESVDLVSLSVQFRARYCFKHQLSERSCVLIPICAGSTWSRMSTRN